MKPYTSNCDRLATTQWAEVASEREGLVADLAHQRELLCLSVRGLTHEQAIATPTVSGLSLAGVIRHAAHTERRWIAGAVGQRELSDRDGRVGFGLEASETVADVIGLYAAVAAETESIVADIVGLDETVRVPAELLPLGSPANAGYWPARSVLVHVVDETANHARAAAIVFQILERGWAAGDPRPPGTGRSRARKRSRSSRR